MENLQRVANEHAMSNSDLDALNAQVCKFMHFFQETGLLETSTRVAINLRNPSNLFEMC